MCGTTIHMLSNLQMLIRKLSTVEGIGVNLKTQQILPSNKVFMYVRSSCGYSKKAYNRLKEIGVKNLIIVDRNTQKFMCPDKWGKILDDNSTVAEDLDKIFPKGFTHPQIFTHEHPQWKHVGGYDQLQDAKILQDDMVNLLFAESTSIPTSIPLLKY